jgi:septal ring factor EnvC (AmiA/AmiB activator)
MTHGGTLGGFSQAVALAAACAVGCASLLAGQEVAVPAELAAIRAEIQELETGLKDLEQRQSDLGTQRAALEAELKLATLKVRETEQERSGAERQVTNAHAEVTRSQTALRQAMERLRLQVTLLATLGRGGLTPLLIEALASGKEAPERVTVSLAMVREHRRQRDLAAELMAARSAALSALSVRQEALSNVALELERRRASLESTRQRVEAELGRLETERRAGAVALGNATEAEARLERLWGNVTRASETRASSIRLLRGGLPWPVNDPVVVDAFGARRDRQYGTLTLSHGIHLGVAKGTTVTTVAAGKVAYSQFFKGYGNLVIVDHGAEVYSLYAGLASMLVSAGQRVGIGEPIGLVGPPEDGKGNFYLEIRVGQEAKDPVAWLKPLGKRGSL